MQQRNKTQRRRMPATPAQELTSPFATDSAVKATEDSLDALFAAETTNTFQQPWQKLDRGSRLDRLRKFVQGYPDLTPAERASLLTAVLQAFELRQLNTKVAVDYDPVNANIQTIRGLRERTNPSGLRTFRIDSTVCRPTTTTQKQKRAPAAKAAAASLAADTPSVLNGNPQVESKGE
jgi:hypothetical protein